MFELTWDDAASKFYDYGVDRGVVYLADGSAVPWLGLKSVDIDDNVGSTTKAIHVDGMKIFEMATVGSTEIQIEAYTAPDVIMDLDGYRQLWPGFRISGQSRTTFGLSYRSNVSSTDGSIKTYKLHLVYGILIRGSGLKSETSEEVAKPATFSWTGTTTPARVPGFKPTGHIEIDGRLLDPETVRALENRLYGAEGFMPQLPTPEEVYAILNAGAIVFVTDNFDGTATITTERESLVVEDGDARVITWASAIDNGETFTISTL